MGAYLQRDETVIRQELDTCFQPVPAPAGTRETNRRHAVRRRTADARHRPRADEQAEISDARRTVARHRAAAGENHFRKNCRDQPGAGPDHFARGAKRESRAGNLPVSAMFWKPAKSSLRDNSAALRQNPKVRAPISAAESARSDLFA